MSDSMLSKQNDSVGMVGNFHTLDEGTIRGESSVCIQGVSSLVCDVSVAAIVVLLVSGEKSNFHILI